MTETIPQPSTRRTALWWYRRPGVVYFFGAGDKAIKIGVTTIFGDLKDDDDVNDDLEAFDLEAFDLDAFDPKVYDLTDNDLTKGVRDCIRQRHKQIESSNHETITLLGLIPFLDGELPARRAELCERELHQHFADLQRFKPHTCGAEWFSYGTQLVEYIEKHSCRPEKFGIEATMIGLPINRE
jgi:hypothetical protein